MASRYDLSYFRLPVDSYEYNLSEDGRWRFPKHTIGIVAAKPQENSIGQIEILVFIQGRVLKTFPTEVYLYSERFKYGYSERYL